jgi:hypothetical protein
MQLVVEFFFTSFMQRKLKEIGKQDISMRNSSAWHLFKGERDSARLHPYPNDGNHSGKGTVTNRVFPDSHILYLQ